MLAEGHKTEVRQLEDNLWGFSVEPKVGIGQRSLLVTTRAIPVATLTLLTIMLR
jgi:hypothetical protein